MVPQKLFSFTFIFKYYYNTWLSSEVQGNTKSKIIFLDPTCSHFKYIGVTIFFFYRNLDFK